MPIPHPAQASDKTLIPRHWRLIEAAFHKERINIYCYYLYYHYCYWASRNQTREGWELLTVTFLIPEREMILIPDSASVPHFSSHPHPAFVHVSISPHFHLINRKWYIFRNRSQLLTFTQRCSQRDKRLREASESHPVVRKPCTSMVHTYCLPARECTFLLHAHLTADALWMTQDARQWKESCEITEKKTWRNEPWRE